MRMPTMKKTYGKQKRIRDINFTALNIRDSLKNHDIIVVLHLSRVLYVRCLVLYSSLNDIMKINYGI